MKIQVSEHISTREEADVLRHLGTEIPGGSQGQEHILRLLDNFYHQSPNGRHHCLVLELVGSNIQANAEARTDYRLPGHLARAASLQLTKALAFIHGRKYSHGGICSLIAVLIIVVLTIRKIYIQVIWPSRLQRQPDCQPKQSCSSLGLQYAARSMPCRVHLSLITFRGTL